MKYFLLVIVFAACNQANVPEFSDPCTAACQSRLRLSCIETNFVSGCERVCEKARSAGLFDPLCAAHATTRTEMLECGVRCQ